VFIRPIQVNGNSEQERERDSESGVIVPFCALSKRAILLFESYGRIVGDG
jgi:hypothetical protein